MDEFEIRSKLKGYYCAPRKLILDLYERKLTYDQFGLLSIIVSFADWDTRHKNYAISDISDNTIAKISNGLSKYKIRKNKYLLYGHNYIDLIEGKNNQKRIIIKNPEIYFYQSSEKVLKNRTTELKNNTT